MKHPCFVFIGLLAMMLGCVGPARVPPASWVAGPPERIVEKDYVVGAPRVVPVGGTIVRYKDYWVRKKIQGHVVLDRQVTIATRYFIIVLPHGRVLRAIGMIEIDNRPYWRFVDATDDQGNTPLYYVHPDGTLADFLYARGQAENEHGMQKIINLAASPVKLPMVSSEEVIQGRNHSNYAMRFDGKDDQSIYIDYLEFSDPRSEKPSRQDKISIPGHQEHLEHDSLRIKIDRCTSTELVCTVLSD